MLKTIKQKDNLSSQLTKRSLFYQRFCRFYDQLFLYAPSANRYNLTVSNNKKFVWYRTAKVGTRTIFNLLQKSNVLLDAEQSYRCYYPYNIYKSYFKFAFIRNPWDRLVSCWQNKVIESNYYNFSASVLSEMKNYKNFVSFVDKNDVVNGDSHLRLQSRLIDLNHVDFIGRFERFEDDLSFVMKKIDIEYDVIERRNVSKNRLDYRSYYDDELKERVGKIYKRDINIFHYEF